MSRIATPLRKTTPPLGHVPPPCGTSPQHWLNFSCGPAREAASYYHWRGSASGPAPCPAPSSHCFRRCRLVQQSCLVRFSEVELFLWPVQGSRGQESDTGVWSPLFTFSDPLCCPREIAAMSALRPLLLLLLPLYPGLGLGPGSEAKVTRSCAETRQVLGARGYSLNLIPPALISGEKKGRLENLGGWGGAVLCISQ